MYAVTVYRDSVQNNHDEYTDSKKDHQHGFPAIEAAALNRAKLLNLKSKILYRSSK